MTNEELIGTYAAPYVTEYGKPLDPAGLAVPDGISPWAMYLLDRPDKPGYGQIRLYFGYASKQYEAQFTVRTPGQKGYMANRMTDIRELSPAGTRLSPIEKIPAGIGLKAFWLYTPTKSLHGEDLTIRKLMIAMQKYSTANKLCSKLRKIEKQNPAT